MRHNSPGVRRRKRKSFQPDPSIVVHLSLLKCHYCGGKAETVDHMQPVAKGGSDSVDNRVPSCKSCNTLKGDMMYEDFMLIVNNGLLGTLKKHGVKAIGTLINIDDLKAKKKD